MKILSRTLIIFGMLAITFQIKAQTQFDNPSFEDWEEIGYGPGIIEPVNWSSIKSSDVDYLNDAAPVVWSRSDDAHTGNYSLHLLSISVFGIVATGMITNGRVHADLNPDLAYSYTDPDNDAWHTRISAKPDSITGWYKANPKPGDYAKIKIVLHRGYVQVNEDFDTTGFIGSANLYLSEEPVTEWTRFSAPIHYYLDDDPEFVLATISSSKGIDAIDSTELWLDDLEFIYNNGTGLTEKNAGNVNVMVENNQLRVLVSSEKTEVYTVRVHDMEGKIHLESTGLTNQLNIHNCALPKGVYVVSVSFGNKLLTKKIVR